MVWEETIVSKDAIPSPGPGGDATDASAPLLRKRKRRWGDAVAAVDERASHSTTATDTTTNSAGITASSTSRSTAGGVVAMDPKAKLKAMQESIQARLAAAKAAAAKQQAQILVPTGASLLSQQQESIPARLEAANYQQQIPLPNPSLISSSTGSSAVVKRAKHYELDLSVTAPTFATEVSIAPKQRSLAPPSATAPSLKQPKNPYLAQSAVEDADPDVIDERLASSYMQRRPRELKFVEPGKWQEIARRRREKAARAEEAGFLSGRKAGQFIQSSDYYASWGASATAELDKNDIRNKETLPPRWDAHTDTTMPLAVEWWDAELLPPKLRKVLARAEADSLQQQSKSGLVRKQPPLQLDSNKDDEKPHNSKEDGIAPTQAKPDDTNNDLFALGASCWEQAALFHSKTAELVQHIVPIRPSSASDKALQPVLHLTKRELKRQRQLRRQEKQRQLQDLQAAGLVPPPEPRLTLQNFIRVLGDRALLDPSKYEQKVTTQIQARKSAHEQRNLERKLTKEQRAAKATAKIQTLSDYAAQSGQIHVALFYVKNLEHPYHRTKLDLNAKYLFITGGVVECPKKAACVIAEGSSKSIQKYVRLLTVRMSWTSGPDTSIVPRHDTDVAMASGDGNEGQEEDKIPHPEFDPKTPEQCRKILKQKGLAHFWDQVMQVATNPGNGPAVKLKLVSSFANSGDDDINSIQEDDHESLNSDDENHSGDMSE